MFASSYLASAHRKPQSHDRLDFRSHATAAKRTAWDVDSLYLRCGSGLDGMTHGGKIGAFVESSPHPAWLASSDGICTYANPALQRLTGLNSHQIELHDWLRFVVDED